MWRFDSTGMKKLSLSDDHVVVDTDEESSSYAFSSVTGLAVIDEYDVIKRLDVFIQSLFAMSMGATFGGVLLFVFVVVQLSSRPTISSVFWSSVYRNVGIISVLLAVGIAVPAVLFYLYYSRIRPQLAKQYEPDSATVEFRFEGSVVRVRNVEREVAYEFADRVTEVVDDE